MMAPHPGQYLFAGLDEAYDEQGVIFSTAAAAIAWLQEPDRDPRRKRRMFRIRMDQVCEQRLIAPAAYFDDVDAP